MRAPWLGQGAALLVHSLVGVAHACARSSITDEARGPYGRPAVLVRSNLYAPIMPRTPAVTSSSVAGSETRTLGTSLCSRRHAKNR
jgi:hypothetical protein